MNERIQELVEQATICYSNGQERTFDKQKFAELIVKECADYFGREGDHRFEVDGNWIAKTIKQHFGIEE